MSKGGSSADWISWLTDYAPGLTVIVSAAGLAGGAIAWTVSQAQRRADNEIARRKEDDLEKK